MARKKTWFAPFIAVGIFFAIAVLSVRAVEYHIGSGHAPGTSGNIIYFNTLQDLRNSLPTDNEWGDAKRLQDATIVLYKDDTSLVGNGSNWEGAVFSVYGTVNVQSADEKDKIISTTLTGTEPLGLRVFSIYGTLNLENELVFKDIRSQVSGTMFVQDGGVVNAEGVRFIGNTAATFGGGIDTNWGASMVNVRDAYFEGNTGGRGGGVEIYYTDEADFTNATFINNKADPLNDPTYNPGDPNPDRGGAIFVTGAGGTTTITMGATDGKISLYQGNEYLPPDGSAPEANSLYTTGSGTYNINIVTEGTGLLDMYDPIYMSPAWMTVNITKTGEGVWNLGGVTRINTGDYGGSAIIRIDEGEFRLYEDAELRMTGANDAFVARNGSNVYISGNNTITGTTVYFESGARLTFDLGYYAPDFGQTIDKRAMLYLSGDTLQVTGTRIDIDGLTLDNPKRNGDYVLIQGTTNIEIGDFDLWIGDANIDVSGRVSERFGYRLGHYVDSFGAKDEKQLVLTISETDNTVLRWGDNGVNEWSVVNKNWTLIRDGSTDSFVPGDTVQFFGDQSRTITITENVLIGHNSVRDQSGTIWYGGENDTTGMHVSGSGHWTFTGKSIVDSEMLGRASLLYDGSGILTLANDEANRYSYNVLAGTGTLSVARGDLLGTQAVYFRNNKTANETSKLHFTGTTTLSTRLVAENGGNGLVTVDGGYGIDLTVTRQAAENELQGGAVYVANGGKLHIQANQTLYNHDRETYGRIIFDGNGSRNDENDPMAFVNEGGAVYVERGGRLVLEKTEFQNNVASEKGGAVSSEGRLTVTGNTFVNNRAEVGGALSLNGSSITTVTDSTFSGNRSSADGGAIHYEASGSASSLTIAASEGKTTLFSGNVARLQYDEDEETWNGTRQSIAISGATGSTANVVIHAAAGGLVDIQDAIYVDSGNFAANITKTGQGAWKQAGANAFFADRGTTLKIEEGTLELYKTDADTGIAAGALFMSNGTLEIGSGGALNSLGGNLVDTDRFILNSGATLGFDLDRSANVGNVGDDPLLTVMAENYDFKNGSQNIDILNLSTVEDGGYGLYNLALFNGLNRDLDLSNMNLLYHGEDMTKFRQNVGELLTVRENGNTTLQVNIIQSKNGTVQWTGNAGDAVWNGESMNWLGTNKGAENLIGAEQFLHGDAVIFTNQGAGTIAVNAGGVVIADQVLTSGVVLPGMTVNNSAGNDYTFYGGSISGNASLLKQGEGKLTFEETNTFTGGMTVEGGTVVGKKADSFGTGDIALTGNRAVLEFDITESGEFGGAITGNGALVKTGGGSLRLTAADSNFSGGVSIYGGELIAEHIGAFGTGDLVTGDKTASGTAVFDLNTGDTPVTFDRVISGTGGVKNMGSTALVLSERNTYSGGTTNAAGATLIATNVDALGTGDVSNLGTLVFNLASSGAGTFDQNISGSGSLIKDGAGELILSGTNTYTGDTIIQKGNLRVETDASLQNSLVRLKGGSMTFGNVTKMTLGGLTGGDAKSNISLTGTKGNAITLTLQTITDEKLVYNGILSGTGSVIKRGLGTQAFAGNNSYSGGTLVCEGRLVSVGVQGFGTGDVINNSEIEFDVDAKAVYAKRIVGTGDLYKSGIGTLELTGNNTYTGDTIVADGTLLAKSFASLGTGDIVIQGADATFKIDMSADASLDRKITGFGTFVKSGKGVLIADSNLDLLGETHVMAGALYINGTSLSETTVFEGAVLGGNGRLDNTATFKSGSTHVVGHKVEGSLSRFTAKELAYESGSRIYIKVGMNGSDKIVATDKIDFARGGGTVDVVLVNLGLDDFDVNTTMPTEYEVFVSENNLIQLDGTTVHNHESGDSTLTLEGVDAAVRFLASPEEGLGVLGYSVQTNKDNSRSIVLNLSTFDSGAVAYLDQNQRNVLRALGDSDVFDRIYMLAQDQRGEAASQLAPMIQTAMPFLTQRAVTQFNLATFNRLRFLREPMALSHDDARNYRGQSHRLTHIHGPSNYIWFQNYGDIMRMSAKGGVPAFQADAYGFNLGFDKGVSHHSSVGVGMGGYFSDVKANDVQQSGDVNSYLISLYGNWAGNSDWMLTGSTGFVFSSYKLERHATPFDTKLHSRHDGTTVFASIEGSKKFLAGRCEVSPYLGLDFIWLGEEAYRERAVGDYSSLALNVKSQDTFTVLSTAGVRLGRTMRMLGGNLFRPSVHAAWVHDWTESAIATRASFAGMPSFKINGASMNRDRAQLGVNFDMTLSHRTDMFAKFNAEVATRYSDLSFHWGIRLGF